MPIAYSSATRTRALANGEFAMRRIDTYLLCGITTALALLSATPARAQGFGGGPTAKPSAVRSVPAETTAAAVKDRNWKPPRTSWGDPSFDGVWSTDDMR